MTDKELLLEQLERLAIVLDELMPQCAELVRDAINLLKDQETVKPTWSQGKAYCGNCGHGLPRKRADIEINYCSYCGKAVKW